MSQKWLVVCGGCTLVVLLAFVPMQASIPVATAVAAEPVLVGDEAVPVEPVPRCVRGFSKDACQGRLDLTPTSQVFFTGCPDTPDLPGCQTLIGLNTLFAGRLGSSGGLCSKEAGVRCDEFPRVDSFTSDFDLTLNSTFDDPCRRRGNWRGKFQFFNVLGSDVIIEGTGAGVLGVGSHRRGCNSVQPSDQPCDLDACENCLDTEFIPDPAGSEVGLWRIGLEGVINGQILSGIQAGGQATLVIQGDLFAPGTLAGGIIDPTQGFSFCGTIDGTTVTFCQ